MLVALASSTSLSFSGTSDLAHALVCQAYEKGDQDEDEADLGGMTLIACAPKSGASRCSLSITSETLILLNRV